MEQRILEALQVAVGTDNIITHPEQLRTYECDGLTNFRSIPAAVVLPTSAAQVQAAGGPVFEEVLGELEVGPVDDTRQREDQRGPADDQHQNGADGL